MALCDLLREILALLKQKRIDERDARARPRVCEATCVRSGAWRSKTSGKGSVDALPSGVANTSASANPMLSAGISATCDTAPAPRSRQAGAGNRLQSSPAQNHASQVVHRRLPVFAPANCAWPQCPRHTPYLESPQCRVQKHVHDRVLAPAVHGPRRERDTAGSIDCLPRKNPRNVLALTRLNLALRLVGPEPVAKRRRQKLTRVGLGGRRPEGSGP